MSLFINRVIETPIYSVEESQKLAQKVRSLKHLWQDRGGYHTIGATSYLDLDEYESETKIRNPILIREFTRGFFDDFSTRLEKISGEKFRYLDDVSYPGFHIFPGDHKDYRFHFDLNDRFVNWPNPEKLDFNKQGSITTVLEMPQVGAAIYSWPDWDRSALESQTPEFYFKHSKIVDGELRPTDPPVETEYRVGSMYSFGMIMHRISPRLHNAKDEYRITLQSQVIWHRDGHWILFW